MLVVELQYDNLSWTPGVATIIMANIIIYKKEKETRSTNHGHREAVGIGAIYLFCMH
jgi:hypothetical protein